MAQLLRNETQNKSGTAVEISQYKGQVDSLTLMLEALTESKELAAQELRMQRAANDEVQFSFHFDLFVDCVCCAILNEASFCFKLREEIDDMQIQRKVLQHNVSGKLEFLEYFRHLVHEMGQDICFKFLPTPASLLKDKEIMSTLSKVNIKHW
jgi:hypothetical protein